MFSKAYWHYVWTRRVRPVKVWYLLVALLVFVVISVLALRHNNQHMSELRQAVYTADQKNQDVVGALQRLQSYVTTHMNADPTNGTSVYPPIQLKYTYERLRQAALQQSNEANTALYTEAQKYCEAQNPNGFSGRGRVPCIEQYITDHGGQPAPVIPDSMYKFNFASPTWSPDLAGWSIVLTMLLAVLVVLRLLLGWILPKVTK
ncbi:MAG TPA: hypothetical protein VFI74_02225 [Candidatus Saccharimonadales bacterium]|nr:hypothetical protein [Candidatus Saccharimonadales bacterium]